MMSSKMIKSSQNRKAGKIPLGPDFQPGNHSVLCGQGNIYASYSGNVQLRNLVQKHQGIYSKAMTKMEKSSIVSTIMNTIHMAAPEGAFVKFEKGQWWECTDSFAREKIGSMFRDCLGGKYRSSSKAKVAARRQARHHHKVIKLDMDPGFPSLSDKIVPGCFSSLSHNDTLFDPIRAFPQNEVYVTSPSGNRHESQVTLAQHSCKRQMSQPLRQVSCVSPTFIANDQGISSLSFSSDCSMKLNKNESIIFSSSDALEVDFLSELFGSSKKSPEEDKSLIINPDFFRNEETCHCLTSRASQSINSSIDDLFVPHDFSDIFES